MSITKKLKWKRNVSEMRFLNDEYILVKESARESAGAFEAYYRNFCLERSIDISALDNKNKQKLDELYGRDDVADDETSDETDIDGIGNTAITHYNKTSENEEDSDYKMNSDDIAIHDAFSKLFKRIALDIHPDRIDKNLSPSEIESRVNMFQDANRSFEEKKYYVLLDIAEKLNITTPKNYDLQIRWMKREIGNIKHKILQEKNTYNYIFFEAETDEERDTIIKRFIFQLFGINVD